MTTLVRPGFIKFGESLKQSARIDVNGESNSSSSTSLVYDFLSDDNPLLFGAWFPIFSKKLEREAVGGGVYEVDIAVQGNIVIRSPEAASMLSLRRNSSGTKLLRTRFISAGPNIGQNYMQHRLKESLYALYSFDLHKALTSFLVVSSTSISNGSIMRLLRAFRRRKALNESPITLLSADESSSSMPMRSVSHLDQFPTYNEGEPVTIG
nr:hypothetical protein Iba_chr02dCG1830 [Ipomoea batatas]